MKLSVKIFLYFAVIFCITLIGYFSLIQSDIAHNLDVSQRIKTLQNNIQRENTLRKNIKQINQQLEQIKKQYPALYSYQLRKPSFSDFFKKFIKVINESNIQLIRLQPLSNGNHIGIVEISMTGAFQNLLNVIDRFSEFVIPVFVHTIKVQKNSPSEIELSLEIRYV